MTGPTDRQAPPGRHLHVYFSPWTSESRAWREGRAALVAGLAGEVIYTGYREGDLPSVQPRPEGGLIERLGPEPSPAGSSRYLRALSLPRWWLAILCRWGFKSGTTLVVAHSLAALPVAVVLKMLRGAPLLYDAHELETEREGWSRTVRRIAGAVEALLIRFCDHVLVVNESIRDWYARQYPHAPISVLRNIPELAVSSEAPLDLRGSLGLQDDELLFLFLGALAKGRGIEIILDVFAGSGRDKHVVFVGYGPLAAEVARAAQGSGNIHLLPPVRPSEVVATAAGADVGISLIEANSLSYTFALPNKVFEYASAGIPMIISDIPEQRRFVESLGIGWIIPSRADALAATVAGLSRSGVQAQVAAADYSVPTWKDEAVVLDDVYRTLLGQTREGRGSAP